MNYLVQAICGPNLAQLLCLCGGKFKERTLALIGLQLIDRLEVLHEKKYLYLNMMPENFVVGLDHESHLIKMIDFSNCRLFKSKNKNTHIPYSSNIKNNANPLFSSTNSHLNVQLSRRVDLASMLYLLVYLHRGKLPWSMIDKKMSQKEYSSAIHQIKSAVAPESLLKGLPLEYLEMFREIKSLKFYEKPDYDLLRKKLWIALMETNYEELKKCIITYDWQERDSLDYDIYRERPKIRRKERTPENQE